MVQSVRAEAAGFPASAINANITVGSNSFRTCNMDEVRRLTMNYPIKSFPFDPNPIFIFWTHKLYRRSTQIPGGEVQYVDTT